MIAVQGGALHYRWGVLDGPVEVFDAANNVLRIEIAGTGSTVSFQFGASGPARSLELMGETFVKRTSQGRGWSRWG